MAGHLILKMSPYASPGDVERNIVTKVGGVEATLANWIIKSKEVAKEDGNNFIEVETAANTEYNGILYSGSITEKFLVNITQVQNVHEY